MDKDTRKILKAAESQGFEIRTSGKGYPLIYRDGEFVTKAAQTTSDQGPYPRNLDTGCDYAAVGSVAARRAW